VVLEPGKEFTGTALKRFARQNAAAFKVPRKVSSESFVRARYAWPFASLYSKEDSDAHA
jgi:hypothetical protein